MELKVSLFDLSPHSLFESRIHYMELKVIDQRPPLGMENLLGIHYMELKGTRGGTAVPPHGAGESITWSWKLSMLFSRAPGTLCPNPLHGVERRGRSGVRWCELSWIHYMELKAKYTLKWSR